MGFFRHDPLRTKLQGHVRCAAARLPEKRKTTLTGLAITISAFNKRSSCHQFNDPLRVVAFNTLEHWAKYSFSSSSTVHRLFQLFGLQPHRTRSFKLSTDPFFVEKLRDVVGLYLNPPDKAVVLCVDEMSQIQALERTQPMLPMGFG